MAQDGFDHDWLIVGSGFGGSVSALRLREKGYRVAVLECGRRYRDEDYAATTWNLRRFMWAPALGLRGILRLTPFKDVFIASGSAVGGGSVVYACTLYRGAPEFFVNPQWAGLEDWAAALKPHYDTAERMLGVNTVPFDSDGQTLLKQVAGHFGVEDTLQAHAGGHLLRRAGPAGGRPLLRRQRAATHRLHTLRRLHGRLSCRREEHAGEELPVVRREGRRTGPARARGGRHPAARRRRRQRRLPRHHRAPGRLVQQAAAQLHHARRGRVGRCAGHQPPAGQVQARRLAARHQRPPRRTGAHQQRIDPRRDAARRQAEPGQRRGDQRQHPSALRHAHRVRHLWRQGRLHVDAVHAAHRRRYAPDPAAAPARQHRAPPARASPRCCGPSAGGGAR